MSSFLSVLAPLVIVTRVIVTCFSFYNRQSSQRPEFWLLILDHAKVQHVQGPFWPPESIQQDLTWYMDFLSEVGKEVRASCVILWSHKNMTIWIRNASAIQLTACSLGISGDTFHYSISGAELCSFLNQGCLTYFACKLSEKADVTAHTHYWSLALLCYCYGCENNHL